MKRRGTQRTLFDLPGATPKRSRLCLEDNSRNQGGGCQDDDGASLNSSIDTSTDQERASKCSQTPHELDYLII